MENRSSAKSKNKKERSCSASLTFTRWIIVVISTVSLVTEADTLRCGRKVVRSGDSSSVVLQNCGKPLSKDSGYEKVRLAEGQKNVRVERWRYKKSSRSLERIVMIYRGRVVAIDTGQR